MKEMIENTDATVYKTEATGTKNVDVEADARYGLMEIVDRLCNELGTSYKYIILAGIPYHIESRVLAGLRSYSVETVVTFNWRHQQYADISFNNLNQKQWKKSLKTIAKQL
ncbi:hypothetical protein AKJ64_00965 [candidate division MSBL1 archaeon SCGC-AAA259E17]|uniref:Uncharacterized protein n=1 Tax=candidate division MSBL1 archaeon SCGC-AAA259E17 TaxID=1698263 RepID=A0A133UGI6_9EURY|nr:hypothetical protein AKJ64_00965 [candidate division MSBL1 archaeon SCGC-AAA259E17]